MVNQRSTQARLVKILTLGCTIFALWAMAAQTRAQIKPSDTFPSLASAELTGGPIPVTAGHVVFVDFWASWCAPCKASFPVYAKIQSDYAARGLSVIAISVDDRPEDYAKFIIRMKPGFTTLHDQKHKLVEAVKVPTMPTSYLLDRDGMVRFVHIGFHSDSTEREVRSEIESLLNEKTSTP